MKRRLSKSLTKPIEMQEIIRQQRTFFRSHVTLDVDYRLDALRRLRRALLKHEGRLCAALQSDLGKSEVESYMSEIGMVLASLRETISHLRGWARPRRVQAPLAQFPSSCWTMPEPYGVTLVMSPWNYPLLLTLDPLVSALAAGNTCVVKPSEQASATAAVLAEVLGETFVPEYVAVVQGGAEVCQQLLEQRWDYIFFTGGSAIGKIVMRAAAEHLTPLTLELGGKSPCIIDRTADVRMAARRIAFGKVLNAGQTCVAPDYALVHASLKKEFVAAFREEVARMVGETPLLNPAYPHIINISHYNRVMALMVGATPVLGGKGDPETLRIEPTVLENVSADSPCMQEEIFGPVLPVLTFDDLTEAEEWVQNRPRPLACYLFTSSAENERRLLSRLHFGGGCVNDTVIHLAVTGLPFGGVGDSGMGAYHGKSGFDTFSHVKSVLRKATWLDLPFRYQPFNGLKRMVLRLFLR